MVEGFILAEQQAGAVPVLWFTGLSGSGKTTLCSAVADRLTAAGHAVEWMDGDVVRHQLSPDLGFTKAPYREARENVRKEIPQFVEIFVDAPLAVCEARDVKGLYRKARSGAIHGFTGIDDPYEVPLAADLVCKTADQTVEECVESVLALLGSRFAIQCRPVA